MTTKHTVAGARCHRLTVAHQVHATAFAKLLTGGIMQCGRLWATCGPSRCKKKNGEPPINPQTTLQKLIPNQP